MRISIIALLIDYTSHLPSITEAGAATDPPLAKRTSMASKIRRSTGNVFIDLGFPAEEAANLVVRADLMIAITKIIESRKLAQAEAASLFRVSQPRVSDLVRGKIDRFSVDGLIAMIGHAGVGLVER